MSTASLQIELLRAISRCKKAWGDDPAYKDIAQKLDQAAQALDILVASPGHREALRAAKFNHAGQEPTDRSEPKSEAQKA